MEKETNITEANSDTYIMTDSQMEVSDVNGIKRTYPTLYILLNSDIEADEKKKREYVAYAVSEFTKTVWNQYEGYKMGSSVSDALTHDDLKYKTYNDWLLRTYIKIVELSPEDIEELFARVLNDANATDVLLDDYTDYNYTFTVENRTIAKMLIKSNEDMTIVGEMANGRVKIKKPEKVSSFIFTYNGIPTVEDFCFKK